MSGCMLMVNQKCMVSTLSGITSKTIVPLSTNLSFAYGMFKCKHVKLSRIII